MATKNEKKARALGSYLRGVDTEEVFADMVMTAENEGGCYPDNPSGAAAKAKHEAIKWFTNMVEDLAPIVADEVNRGWNGECDCDEPDPNFPDETYCEYCCKLLPEA